MLLQDPTALPPNSPPSFYYTWPHFLNDNDTTAGASTAGSTAFYPYVVEINWYMNIPTTWDSGGNPTYSVQLSWYTSWFSISPDPSTTWDVWGQTFAVSNSGVDIGSQSTDMYAQAYQDPGYPAEDTSYFINDTDLSTGDAFQPADINNSNVVVGALNGSVDIRQAGASPSQDQILDTPGTPARITTDLNTSDQNPHYIILGNTGDWLPSLWQYNPDPAVQKYQCDQIQDLISDPAYWIDTISGINDYGCLVGEAYDYNDNGNLHAVLLVPVNITVCPTSARWASSDVMGVMVHTQDSITISLSGTSSNVNLPLPAGQPVWKSRQLNSDGTYTAWTPMGPTCTGTQFDYTPTNGGIFQLEAVFFGDDTDAAQFVRKKDDPYSCHAPTGDTPTLTTGSLDAFGVTSTYMQEWIQADARSWLGSTAYAANGPSPDSGPTSLAWKNQPKCTLFVADVCDDAGAPVPNINSWLGIPYVLPPIANQWSGLEPATIAGWTLLGLTAAPEPGRVVARGEPYGHSGHSGILDYDGQWISAGDLWVNRLANLATYYTQLNFTGSHQPAGQNRYGNGN